MKNSIKFTVTIFCVLSARAVMLSNRLDASFMSTIVLILIAIGASILCGLVFLGADCLCRDIAYHWRYHRTKGFYPLDGAGF